MVGMRVGSDLQFPESICCKLRHPYEWPRADGKILDELIIAGELQESSKKSVLKIVCQPY